MSSFQAMAANYSGKYKHKLLRLAEPLFQTLGINYFFYLYIANDRNCSFMGTNVDLIQHYLDEKMHHCNPFFTQTDQVKTGVYLYDSVQHSDFKTTMQCLENKYDTKHSCLMTRKVPQGAIIYGFALPAKRKEMESMLINQAPLLRRFIQYFENEMSPVLKRMHEQPISLFSEMDVFLKKNRIGVPEIQLDESKIYQFLTKTSNNIFWESKLTKREIEVVKVFLKGKTAREIAQILSLSKRTVEHHFTTIKDKLECCSRSELFERLQDFNDWNFLSDI